ncbi:MAG: glycosyltransferase family 4 protein [Motilibacteraceae bacterium]
MSAAGSVRELVRRRGRDAVRTAMAARRRRPVVPVGARSQLPSVYFLTPDHDRPAGGVQVMYRHVDALNAAGVPAAVLHQRPGFRCTWFPNDTVVTDARHAQVCPEDLLVVPEIDADLLPSLPPTLPHVVLDQSGHLTWARRTEALDRHYRSAPALRGVVTVSEHCVDLLSYAFPRLPVARVHDGVDTTRFHPPERPAGRRIAYLPRRGRDDAVQVLAMLRVRGALHGWEVVALDGLPQARLADELRRTTVFLTFPYQEGFGLPAAEAMACGCYVVGFHGYGGREYLLPGFSSPIETGDTLTMARTVEAVLRREREEPGWCARRGRLAAEHVRTTYSMDRERREVQEIYPGFWRHGERVTRWDGWTVDGTAVLDQTAVLDPTAVVDGKGPR